MSSYPVGRFWFRYYRIVHLFHPNRVYPYIVLEHLWIQRLLIDYAPPPNKKNTTNHTQPSIKYNRQPHTKEPNISKTYFFTIYNYKPHTTINHIQISNKYIHHPHINTIISPCMSLFSTCIHPSVLQASMQEVYEGKLRLLDEEVRHLQHQVLRHQKENANQKELNNNVQRAMTDMKTKYDSSATSWAKARKDMQDKLESVMSVSSSFVRLSICAFLHEPFSLCIYIYTASYIRILLFCFVIKYSSSSRGCKGSCKKIIMQKWLSNAGGYISDLSMPPPPPLPFSRMFLGALLKKWFVIVHKSLVLSVKL